ncbi:TMV resistance protein N [Spatholobus suberectus]|nr:TMV resistance protein N [Spatholobus suberectus]
MASSSSRPHGIYDVFINFRGGDTRSNFVSHLHHALSNAGVNTFFDEENLLKGMQLEELMRAIEVSQISLVVFSKTYADSSWCLNELENIIKCRSTYGQIVVPIFYNVDPSHVRHRKGAFGRALKALAEKTYSGKCLEYVWSTWSRALAQAANFSGWDAKNYR